MKKFITLLAALLGLNSQALAQDEGVACGMVGCGIFVWLIFVGGMLAVGVLVIVLIFKFIRRDSIARGLGPNSSMPWLALLGLLGLLIYVLQRPQGVVMPCRTCGKGRMQGFMNCPNCGNP